MVVRMSSSIFLSETRRFLFSRVQSSAVTSRDTSVIFGNSPAGLAPSMLVKPTINFAGSAQEVTCSTVAT